MPTNYKKDKTGNETNQVSVIGFESVLCGEFKMAYSHKLPMAISQLLSFSKEIM